jgi:predicted nucleic acid-binding Zn ribbon protein
MERNCLICGNLILKDRGKRAVTCSHKCSIIYLRGMANISNRTRYTERINNRCIVCNKLITPGAIHCAKHKIRILKRKNEFKKC